MCILGWFCTIVLSVLLTVKSDFQLDKPISKAVYQKAGSSLVLLLNFKLVFVRFKTSAGQLEKPTSSDGWLSATPPRR